MWSKWFTLLSRVYTQFPASHHSLTFTFNVCKQYKLFPIDGSKTTSQDTHTESTGKLIKPWQQLYTRSDDLDLKRESFDVSTNFMHVHLSVCCTWTNRVQIYKQQNHKHLILSPYSIHKKTHLKLLKWKWCDVCPR